jgi:hypothetical protein
MQRALYHASGEHTDFADVIVIPVTVNVTERYVCGALLELPGETCSI